jgi:hypothetical protein
MKFGTCFAAALLSLAATDARAGTVVNGVWAPSGCGKEPAQVTIDLSTADSFNKSLDANDKYEDDSKKYVDCAFKEATADNKALADSQKAIQDKHNDSVNKNEADIKLGMDKYAKKK